MILITGGAGFIGSNLHAALAAAGHEAVIVDTLGNAGKWRNLAAHPPARIVAPENLEALLELHPPVELVYHLGAISETTATDGDLVWHTNVTLSWRLFSWCAARDVRFIYASSASTYGDGSNGFDDDPAGLDRLRPLNLYGWTKHAFDLRVLRAVGAGDAVPRQWVGLKLFNVFGPNEYHKGPMISVVKRKFDEVVRGDRPTLFRSDKPGIADGLQQRDFIWIDDIVDVLLWLRDTPSVSGLFNLGTGQARTYLDLARAVCTALGQQPDVRFVPMPAELAGQYQSFTEARMDRLRAAGYPGQFTPLEEGVRRYVQDHLVTGALYR